MLSRVSLPSLIPASKGGCLSLIRGTVPWANSEPESSSSSLPYRSPFKPGYVDMGLMLFLFSAKAAGRRPDSGESGALTSDGRLREQRTTSTGILAKG